MHKCSNCGKTDDNLSSCADCGDVKYCGRLCQTIHWKSHRPHCKYVVNSHANGILGNASIMGFMMSLLDRFEVYGRTSGPKCGYIKCIFVREDTPIGYKFSGFITFIPGLTDNMKKPECKGKNLIELHYDFNNKVRNLPRYIAQDECRCAHDTYKKLQHRIFAVDVNQNIGFECDDKIDFRLVAQGVVDGYAPK